MSRGTESCASSTCGDRTTAQASCWSRKKAVSSGIWGPVGGVTSAQLLPASEVVKTPVVVNTQPAPGVKRFATLTSPLGIVCDDDAAALCVCDGTEPQAASTIAQTRSEASIHDSRQWNAQPRQ